MIPFTLHIFQDYFDAVNFLHHQFEMVVRMGHGIWFYVSKMLFITQKYDLYITVISGKLLTTGLGISWDAMFSDTPIEGNDNPNP